MNYNLTPKQKSLLKAIVEEVRNGNLPEETNIIFLPNNVPYFTDPYKGKVGKEALTNLNLQALATHGLLNISTYQSTITFAPTDYGYKAVDNNFGASLLASSFEYNLSRINKITLCKMLYNNFSLHEGELESLCFEAGGEFDDVGGENTRDSKCQHLVEYMARNNLLIALIETAREKRPHVDWSVVYLQK